MHPIRTLFAGYQQTIHIRVARPLLNDSQHPAPRPFPPAAIPSNFTMSSWFPKDDQSTKPWGTPRLPVSIYASSTATWGTLPTTTSSTSSLQAVIDHDTSWSPPNNIVAGSSRGSSNASPSLYPSVGTSPSVAGSYGVCLL